MDRSVIHTRSTSYFDVPAQYEKHDTAATEITLTEHYRCLT